MKIRRLKFSIALLIVIAAGYGFFIRHQKIKNECQKYARLEVEKSREFQLTHSNKLPEQVYQEIYDSSFSKCIRLNGLRFDFYF